MAGYYDPADESIVMRAGGGLVMRRWFFRVDINNKRLENLTQKIETCNIKWGKAAEGEAPMTCTFTWHDDGEIDYLTDYVAPVIRWEYTQGRREQTQLGLFALSMPSRKITSSGIVSTVNGRDLTWVMKNQIAQKNINFNAGQYYDDVFREICALGGVTRTDIRDTNRQLSTGRTIRRGKNLGQAFNTYAGAIGWYNMQADLTGKIVTLPYRNTGNVAKVGLITEKNIIGDIESPAPPSEFPNIVRVTVQRGDKDPIIGYARNNDPDSPASTVRQKKEIVREFSESDIETQADADASAAEHLRQLSQYYDTIRVVIPPAVAFLGQNQRVDIDFWSEKVHFTGSRAIRSWELGMEPGTESIKLELGRTINLG